jgi:hypothetical protein
MHQGWGGGLPRPTGRSPPGAEPPPVGCPIPADRWRTLHAAPMTAPAKLTGASSAPGALSPRKITVKGALEVRPFGQTLDRDLPRQDPGTYWRARSLEVPAVGDERPFQLTPRPE